jgi:Na+/proline symporter
MNDERQAPTGRSITEGVSAQAFGGAIGTTFILYQASNGHYYPAGMELALGTVFGTVAYILYKVFAPRLLRWSKGEPDA